MVAPITKCLNGTRVVLGSQSPRRVELIHKLGLDCVVLPSCVDEGHTDGLAPNEVPLVLAERKAKALLEQINKDDLLITADTVVALGDEVLEKPHTLQEAKLFLRRLSGQWHSVHTAFVLHYRGLCYHEVVTTDVRMAPLSEDEIDYYVSEYLVMDKAGGYGIQDWIGHAAVLEIRGCYNNVVGLPTAHLYQALKEILLRSQGD